MLDLSSLLNNHLFYNYSARGYSPQIKIEGEEVKVNYVIGKNKSKISSSTLIRINKIIQLQLNELELNRQERNIPEEKIKSIEENKKRLIAVINILKKNSSGL